MGVAIKMYLTVFLLIFGTAGSLGDPLSEGKDVLGAEILKRMERMDFKMQEDEKKIEQLEQTNLLLQEDLKETIENCRAMKTIEEDVHKNTQHIQQINKRLDEVEKNEKNIEDDIVSIEGI